MGAFYIRSELIRARARWPAVQDILALNTEASGARFKGRPWQLIADYERPGMAAALLFENKTPREPIAAVLPDILIKRENWVRFVAGREEVEGAAGKVSLLALDPGFSATNIEKGRLTRQPRTTVHQP